MMSVARIHVSRLRTIKAILSSCVLLISQAAWPAMSDKDAGDLVRAMSQTHSSYADIILTLMEDGRTLPEATELTMLEVKQLKLRTELARTALCLSRDVKEAELVTNAAIAAVAPGDAAIENFVSEYVKYHSSSCLVSDTIDQPVVDYARGRGDTDRGGVIPCACQNKQALTLRSAPRASGSLLSGSTDPSESR